MKTTIEDLLESEHAFMGSDWVYDPTVTDGPMPGKRYAGEVPCINCSDVFFWGCADAVKIGDLSQVHQAIDDCGGDVAMGCLLYCAREYKERPQGAFYTYIPAELWHLFNACGPEREVGLGNPFAPSEFGEERK